MVDYTRFASDRVLSSKSSRGEGLSNLAPVDEAIKAIYEVSSDKFSNWDSFCSWCMVAARAEHVLVTIPHHTILASQGSLHREQVTSIDVWIAKNFTNFPYKSTSNQSINSLTIESNSTWLTSIYIDTISSPITGDLVVTIQSTNPLFHDVRQAIVLQAQYTSQLV